MEQISIKVSPETPMNRAIRKKVKEVQAETDK